MQFYVDGGANGNVTVSNNVFMGSNHDLELRKVENLNITGGHNITLTEAPDTDSHYSGTGDMQVLPSALFVDVDAGDYNLQEASAAVNEGIQDYDYYLEDIRGYLVDGPIDIGAYEFSMSIPTKSLDLVSIESDINSMLVYPNPAIDNLNVRITSHSRQEGLLRLIDLYGREILLSNHKLEVGENNIRLNLAGISKGVYLLRFELGKTMLTDKIIIK